MIPLFLKPLPHEAEPPPETDAAEKAVKIMYHLSMLSASEMAKPKTKREANNTFLNLMSSEPWDTIKAQLLVKISSFFMPLREDFANYDVVFTVPRHSTAPLNLRTEEDYTFMKTQALKGKDLTVHLKISGNRPEAEKVQSGSGQSRSP